MDNDGEILYLEGRLILNLLEENFSVEVDIVLKDSKKIYHHLGILSDFNSEQEAIEAGIHHVKRSLQKNI